MTIPRAEHVIEMLITPRILIRLLFVWLVVTMGGSFVAINLAVPGAFFGAQAEAQGAMAPLWLDEFNETVPVLANDARALLNDAARAERTPQEVTPQAIKPSSVPATQPIFPDRIIIEKLNIDLPVDNPTSTNVVTLDEALHDAVVRYPGSGTLEGTTNVLIFGHSSYLPIVRNPLYKAFNGIQNLNYGDEIQVQSGNTTYVYKVFNVRKASAEEDEIPLQTGKRQITLLTCDSFGKKSDRFVVEAEFVHAF